MPENTDRTTKTMQVRCCIAGGGPAGMMLGLPLARAGVAVLVLENHADFLWDFRGDTVYPSTLEVIHELGLLDEFLKRPHQEARRVAERPSLALHLRAPVDVTDARNAAGGGRFSPPTYRFGLFPLELLRALRP